MTTTQPTNESGNMATIQNEISKINAALAARERLAQANAAELVMEERLEQHPNCPQAQHDYRVASASVDECFDALQRLS